MRDAYIMTNTQNIFNVLHDGPLLLTDLVLREFTTVGFCKEVIYGLRHHFVNNDRLITVTGNNVRVAVREVG
jgi:hypothetical protein